MNNFLIPKATSSLKLWLNYLKHLHSKPIDLGLERIRHVATELNLLHPAPLVITVGGTNGKGTTCRLLETILIASGVRVGVYSSPHLLSYTERVRIQGYELPEMAHSEVMAKIESGRGSTSLSYFEFGTLAALHMFKQASLDVVILEVGLGGRLDATNIIDADIAVITTIALDHTDYLGPDRASIAIEKAGIFRKNKLAVIGEPDRPVTLDATNCDAVLYACDRDWWWQKYNDYWRWWDNSHEFNNLPLPIIPLGNAATALAVITKMPFFISEKAIYQGLLKASLPGRFQFFKQAPLTILDVAHNPHAACYLAKCISAICCKGKVRAVVGMLADKDIYSTLACLFKEVNVWYCASLNCPRAASAAQIARYLNSEARQFKNVSSAWHQAVLDAVPEDCILVFGSFHTIAQVINLTQKIKRELTDY